MSDPVMNIKRMTVLERLKLRSAIDQSLKDEGIVRSANIVGDYTETLCALALKMTPVPLNKGHDLIDAEGRRVEVKGIRLTKWNGQRQTSAIRELDRAHFTHIAIVVFNPDYTVLRGCLMDHDAVKKRARWIERNHYHVINANDVIWADPGVRDITAELIDAQNGTPLRETAA